MSASNFFSSSATDKPRHMPAGLAETRTRLKKALQEAGRAENSVTLVAVSKTFGADVIRPVLEAGQRVFGENRVQEAAQKWPPLRKNFPDTELHLIGPLQTNKVEQAIALFDVIQTLDREKLAQAFVRARERGAVLPRLFIQVNTGDETQKAGVSLENVEAFIRTCRDDFSLPVTGLMCLPPRLEEPSLHFALLEKIARRNGLDALSMGMSADFETAVQFGASHVRTGSAIFGPRGQKA